MVMFSGWKKDKTGVKKKKNKVGFFKRLTLFALVFAVVFNLVLGPIISNVSAASIEANQQANSSSVVGNVLKSTPNQFGGILSTIKGAFDAFGNFISGMIGMGLCVVEFIKTSPTSLTLALIACPAIEQISGAVQFTENIMKGILPVVLFTSNTGSATQMRNITNGVAGLANIIFAVIFLIIIVSTAFGGGEGRGPFSNYGIKKILPKLLIMAVAINTSFYICAALVDLSNIVGNGIGPFVDSIQGTNSVTEVREQLQSKPNTRWLGDLMSPNNNLHASDYVKGLGQMPYDETGTNAATVSVIVALVLVCVVVLMIVQIITAIVLIAIRNVLIVALVVVSPLAFVAGILPNTNKLFQTWFHHFSHLLLVYPAVMVLFAIAKIAALAYPINSSVDLCIMLMILASPVFFIKQIINSTSSLTAQAAKGISSGVMTVAAVAVTAATMGAGGAAMAAAGAAKGGMAASKLGMAGNFIKGAAGKGFRSTGLGKTIMGGADEIGGMKDATARKTIASRARAAGGINNLNSEDGSWSKREQRLLSEAQDNAALSGAGVGAAAGAAIGGMGSGAPGTINANHVDLHGGTISGAGGSGNSLAGLQQLIDGIKTGGDASAAASAAASTGLLSPADIAAIGNGSFTGSVGEAMAQNVITMDQSQWSGLSQNSQEMAVKLVTDNNNGVSSGTRDAARDHMTNNLNVNVNVNAKVSGDSGSLQPRGGGDKL